jgi:hypothetical protein
MTVLQDAPSTSTPTAAAEAAGSPAPTSRRWAAAGLASGVTAAVGIVASGYTGAVYDPALSGDAPAIAEAMQERIPAILVFHTSTMAATLLLVVFAAGLARRLRQALPADSLLPAVAASGLALVSVAGLIGTGLTTEFAFMGQQGEDVVPEVVVMFSHWIGTLPWLWAGAGVSALAVAAAWRSHGAVAAWIGRTSAVLGVITVLFAVSPLQYMAGMFGPVWLIAVSAGLLFGDRRR